MDDDSRARHIVALMQGRTDAWIPMRPYERTKVFAARRQRCKKLIGQEDDSPKQWRDYAVLMEYEIETARLAAMRAAERRWSPFVKTIPALQEHYDEIFTSGKYQNIPSDDVRERLIRRAAVRAACNDLHVLGACEILIQGGTHWGLEP